ncbi:MAG: BNR repeat-containing protein [Chitinophagaceae bacterium]
MQNNIIHASIIIAACVIVAACSPARSVSTGQGSVKMINVDSGWAANSVNTAVFRKNSLVSFDGYQYIAYYGKDGYVMLGKRKLSEDKWELKTTSYKGNVADAHNVISIMIDGDGYLHMAWDHHNNRLHYAKSLQPGSLELSAELSMTGQKENRVSYPEFYRLPNGNLLFFYRDGGSGNGALVMNRYNRETKQWSVLQSNVIDGEGKRNAYWQACIDDQATIHLSWVWRESPDVASNHDICYARSKDGGLTWEQSNGSPYTLPIKESTAEIACKVPQRSELINQTSMFSDASGRPHIATYWRSGNGTVQYHLVFKNENGWQVQDLGFRTTAFSLSGAGTKRIPISRPQVIAWQSGSVSSAAIIFRDNERSSRISVAVCNNLQQPVWTVSDLDTAPVGSWEPTYDTELWKQKGVLHLFVQKVDQADAEGISGTPPQMVKVLEWKPLLRRLRSTQ